MNFIPPKKKYVFLILMTCLVFTQAIKPANAGFGTHRVCGTSSAGVDCKCKITCKGKIQNCATKSCACASDKETAVTIPHITDEFIQHREWLIKAVWEAHLLPSLMMMTEQISAVAMQQMFAIGSFFDAKHQLETQRMLQNAQAEAHKEYHPSEGMCTFGTNTRSLAASDRNVDLTQITLSQKMQDRSLLTGDGISGSGPRDDLRSRLAHFKKTYCNKADLGNSLENLCNATDTSRLNNDLNFTKLIDQERTLDIDFSNTAVTENETDLIALATNLYGQNLFPYVREDKIALSDGRIIRKGAYTYMKLRSLLAKESVAQAAYAAQAAIKSKGTSEVQPYMQAIVEEMGLSEAEALKFINERPSYYAQMGLLTKTLYQNPTFYTDLYDKPVNIDRKIVSMQALEIMQRRDMYRSNLRREAIEAVWLEGALETLEDDVDNRIAETYQENGTLNLKGLD